MVEPTETESRDTLDEFVRAMGQIHAEALSEPEKVFHLHGSTDCPDPMPDRSRENLPAPVLVQLAELMR